MTFHTNVGVAHKSSVVLDGNCKCYIEYKAGRPRNPCGPKNSSLDPKITARYQAPFGSVEFRKFCKDYCLGLNLYHPES